MWVGWFIRADAKFLFRELRQPLRELCPGARKIRDIAGTPPDPVNLRSSLLTLSEIPPLRQEFERKWRAAHAPLAVPVPADPAAPPAPPPAPRANGLTAEERGELDGLRAEFAKLLDSARGQDAPHQPEHVTGETTRAVGMALNQLAVALAVESATMKKLGGEVFHGGNPRGAQGLLRRAQDHANLREHILTIHAGWNPGDHTPDPAPSTASIKPVLTADSAFCQVIDALAAENASQGRQRMGTLQGGAPRQALELLRVAKALAQLRDEMTKLYDGWAAGKHIGGVERLDDDLAPSSSSAEVERINPVKLRDIDGVSPSEAAQALGLKPAQVVALLTAGTLKGYQRVSGKWKISRADLLAFIRDRKPLG